VGQRQTEKRSIRIRRYRRALPISVKLSAGFSSKSISDPPHVSFFRQPCLLLYLDSAEPLPRGYRPSEPCLFKEPSYSRGENPLSLPLQLRIRHSHCKLPIYRSLPAQNPDANLVGNVTQVVPRHRLWSVRCHGRRT
jgi:hypothetical protein